MSHEFTPHEVSIHGKDCFGHLPTMNEDEKQELRALQAEMERCSMGDRPPSMAAVQLRRLIELESKLAGGQE